MKLELIETKKETIRKRLIRYMTITMILWLVVNKEEIKKLSIDLLV